MNKPDVFKFDDSLYYTKEGLESIVGVVEKQKTPDLVIVITQSKEVRADIELLIELAIERNESLWAGLEAISSKQYDLISGIPSEKMRKDLEFSVRGHFKEMEEILKSVWLVQDCSGKMKEHILGIGSLWTAELLNSYFLSAGKASFWADSRDILTFISGERGLSFDMETSSQKLNALVEKNGTAGVFIVTGSRGIDSAGQSVSLGRHGSELTASVYGSMFSSQRIIFWSSCDGVMSADPSKVPGAVVIPTLSYEEATELAHFGSEIIHPEAINPAIQAKIPIFIKNIKNPAGSGTVIHSEGSGMNTHPVKGFSIVDNISLLNVEGAGMVGVPGISSRLFSSLHKKDISVILISQASSEHSICCAVPEDQAEDARDVARETFAEELGNFRINTINIERGCAILGAVGDRMSGTPGISAKFFGALGQAGVNVRAIAQGASERNISAVVRSEDATRALRAVHSGFYLSNQTLSVGVIGPGLIGSTLLDQIAGESASLHDRFGVDIRVRGITRSTKMLLGDPSLDMADWREVFEESTQSADLDAFVNHIDAEYIPPFSTLVKEARDLGFTEPDPRDDLSGMDIVRKTVILAREVGHSVEVGDVPVKSLVPAELADVSLDDFLSGMDIMDGDMDRLYHEAAERHEVIKYTGIIEEDGSCSVRLKSYPDDHPFAGISGSDNIVAFTTERYNEQPLIVRGPGAGPEVTAGGIFADLLRLASYLGARL